MEATVEASGAAPGAGPAEGAEGAEATPSGVDLSPVLSRFDELSNSFTPRLDEMSQRLEQFEQALYPQEEQGQDPYEGLDQLYDEAGQIDMGRIAQAIQSAEQRGEQRAQEMIAPLQEMVDNLKTTLDAQGLTSRIPELNDPEVAAHTVAEVKSLAERFSQETGIPREAAARLVRSPSFVETVHKAMYADRAAAGEEPAVPDSMELEAGGGAQPAGQGTGSILDEIMQSRQGRQRNAFGI